MLSETSVKTDKKEDRTVIINNRKINLRELDHILLSHECVLEGRVNSVSKGNRSLLKADITLKGKCPPSEELKQEIAWYVGTEIGIMTPFSSIDFNLPVKQVNDGPVSMPVVSTPTAPSTEEGPFVHISGHKIDLAEVTTVLEKNSDVEKAKVIGVPDERKGEILKAYVKLQEGSIPSNELKTELAWLARVEAGPMVLFKDIEFTHEFPEETGEPLESAEKRMEGDGMVIIDTIGDDENSIHISSHRISSTEVTRALLGHPDVSDAAVVAVPDEKRGEVLKAFIRLNQGVEPSNDLKLELAWHVMTELEPIVVFKSIDLDTTGTATHVAKEILREDENVCISGHTVLSLDVEDCLKKHHAVTDAIVVGVPDEKKGEVLQAFVTLKNGMVPSEDLMNELAWYSRIEIGAEVVFRSIRFREYLPKTTNRQVLRNILRADAMNIPTKLSITVAD